MIRLFGKQILHCKNRWSPSDFAEARIGALGNRVSPVLAQVAIPLLSRPAGQRTVTTALTETHLEELRLLRAERRRPQLRLSRQFHGAPASVRAAASRARGAILLPGQRVEACGTRMQTRRSYISASQTCLLSF